jgi:hypothetical protein
MRVLVGVGCARDRRLLAVRHVSDQLWGADGGSGRGHATRRRRLRPGHQRGVVPALQANRGSGRGRAAGVAGLARLELPSGGKAVTPHPQEQYVCKRARRPPCRQGIEGVEIVPVVVRVPRVVTVCGRSGLGGPRPRVECASSRNGVRYFLDRNRTPLRLGETGTPSGPVTVTQRYHVGLVARGGRRHLLRRTATSTIGSSDPGGIPPYAHSSRRM